MDTWVKNEQIRDADKIRQKNNPLIAIDVAKIRMQRIFYLDAVLPYRYTAVDWFGSKGENIPH